MLHLTQGQQIATDRRVYVYYNLHRKIFSIRQAGRVVAHADALTLTRCRFRVSPAGRAKVLRERKKNVHAGVSGYLATDQSLGAFVRDPRWIQWPSALVRYNPYQSPYFMTQQRGPGWPGPAGTTRTGSRPVTHAEMVRLEASRGTVTVDAVRPEDKRSSVHGATS